MCWCRTCSDTSNDAYDNRICPCGEESPCRFHGGVDPYAASYNQAEPVFDPDLLRLGFFRPVEKPSKKGGGEGQ